MKYENLTEGKQPLALRVGSYYNPHVWREDEYKAVGTAFVAGYTKVLTDKESDETVWLVKPEELARPTGVKLSHKDELTLEESLGRYFELQDVFKWLEGKVEEVEKVEEPSDDWDDHTLPLLTFED